VIIALIGGLFPMDNVAHAAHLGGMLGGLVYLNLMRPNRTGS
jgi:membrane associated rhomboid family serine protease